MSVAVHKNISSLISGELNELDTFIRVHLKSKTALLDTVIRYILRQRGKRARPMLVFLSAGAAGGITHRATVGAAMLELLHTATLVHDDVVDNSAERRGIASINAIWKNKVAVLAGDYLLSQGLLLAMQNNETGFLHITSNAVRRMSEGELLQIQKSRQRTITEDTYFQIISDKTASLISACCEIGAVSASASPEVQQAFCDFGELLGRAFQIRDDVLDYTSRSTILGKPVGNDITENKITLPLIYACNNATSSEARAMIKLVKGKNPGKKEVSTVMKFVNLHQGTQQAQAKAHELQARAVRLLDILPPSSYKEALVEFSKFAVERPS
ncbi:MAG: polyprenyl synthetase [Ignavibacteria bacterium]